MDSSVLHLMNLAHHPWKARMWQNVAQSIAAFTDPVIIAFDSISFDPNGNCTTGAAAKYTCPVPGYYQCNWRVLYISGVTYNEVGSSLLQNGSIVSRGTRMSAATTAVPGSGGSDLIKCAAGDTLQVGGYQSSTAAQNTATGAREIFFSVHFFSPA